MLTFPPCRDLRQWPWLLALLALWLVLPPKAHAQFDGFERQVFMSQQARMQAAEQMRGGVAVPLEGAIDPQTYVVGPGDVFSVAIGGGLALEVAAMVSADGMLVIPEVGSYPVAGLTLAEAKAQAEAALRRTYRNVNSSISLVQPRQFYVHVSGAVQRPGRHVMLPIARVEDAVSAGMMGESPLLALRNLQQLPRTTRTLPTVPALRSVEVRRTNGEAVTVDLLRYYATGDADHNPYLQDGDALFVPTIETDGERFVFVEHEPLARDNAPARPPMRYDYRPDDTVTTLLLVNGGSELLESTPSVRLLRTEETGEMRAMTVNVAAIRAGTQGDVALRPLDRIQVPRATVRRGTVHVEGAVAHPGRYPIVEGRTTLRDLVEAVGGVLPNGLLRAAYLERQGFELADPAADPATLEQAHGVNPVQRAALLERATFQGARLSDLPFGSRNYMAREMLQFQRVSLAFGDDPASIPAITLRDGDRLVVPEDLGAVLVIGQVRNPGYVSYTNGASAEAYIAEAGGRGPAATTTYVRDAGTGAFRSPGEAPIRSGDVIFVDRTILADTESLQSLALHEQQLNLMRAQEQRHVRFEMIRTGLSVVGTLATVVTTYLIVRNN